VADVAQGSCGIPVVGTFKTLVVKYQLRMVLMQLTPPSIRIMADASDPSPANLWCSNCLYFWKKKPFAHSILTKPKNQT